MKRSTLINQANQILGVPDLGSLIILDPESPPSNSYQYKFQERLHPDLWDERGAKGNRVSELEMIDLYFTKKYIRAGLHHDKTSDTTIQEIHELEEELENQFWYMVKTVCTPNQQQVVNLTYQGLTQEEIAKRLGINQSSVVKCLTGNLTYPDRIRHGGVANKLTHYIKNSSYIQYVMQELSHLPTRSLRLPFFRTFKKICHLRSSGNTMI